MFAKRKLLAVGTLMFILGCSQNQPDTKDFSLLEGLKIADTTSPSSAIENVIDPARKFIRTADLKFKVKNVFEATNKIEEVTSHHGGFVTLTDLSSSHDEIKTKAVSKDSVLETTYYTVRNDIILRVPNSSLDKVLREISASIEYLDYRVIKADDVSLQLLLNKRAMTRNLNMEVRVTSAIDKSGKKLNDIVDAEKILQEEGEKKDGSDISNMDLIDKINYSTVSLTVYQRQASKAELVPTNKYVDEYRPNFGSQLLASFKVGWRVLEYLLISVLKLWPLIFIGLLIFFFYKRKEKVYAIRSRN